MRCCVFRGFQGSVGSGAPGGILVSSGPGSPSRIALGSGSCSRDAVESFGWCGILLGAPVFAVGVGCGMGMRREDLFAGCRTGEARRRWYREVYLRSKHWQMLRSEVLSRRFCCERCGVSWERALDVHHRTYERLGGEALSDLEVLCRSCHDHAHLCGAVGGG